jgi:hypothetical protein
MLEGSGTPMQKVPWELWPEVAGRLEMGASVPKSELI